MECKIVLGFPSICIARVIVEFVHMNGQSMNSCSMLVDQDGRVTADAFTVQPHTICYTFERHAVKYVVVVLCVDNLDWIRLILCFKSPDTWKIFTRKYCRQTQPGF